MSALFGKVAIITGASSGIGRAAASLFAAEGAAVVVGARGEPGLHQVVARIRDDGGLAVACAGDVAHPAYARQLVAIAQDKFGGLDIAFNNAGTVGNLGTVPAMTLENWNAVIGCNLTSAFLAAREQLPALLARGGVSINRT